MKYNRLRLLFLLCLVIAGLLPVLSSYAWQDATPAAQDEQRARKQAAVARKKLVQQLVIEHRDKLSVPPRQTAGDETAPALVAPCDPMAITLGQTKTGQLTTNSCSMTIGDGTYADVYSFTTTTANQQVAISLGSNIFDAYLYLCESNGTVITQDDDGGGGTNARIPANSGFFTLSPVAGTTYWIVANTLFAGQTGEYQLSLTGDANNGLRFYPLSKPIRLLDTRNGVPNASAFSTPDVPVTGQTSITQQGNNLTHSNINIPNTAQALVGTVTAINSQPWNFLTFYPSDSILPLIATINPVPGQPLTNAFTVRLGSDGKFKIFAQATTDVVVDVTGYYAPPGTGGLYFHPLPSPVRLLDTRGNESGVGSPNACTVNGNQPLTGGSALLLQGNNPTCGTTGLPGIPATAQALVGNATTVGPAGGGDLRIFPDEPGFPPLMTSSWYLTNEIVNAQFVVGLSASGNFKVYTYATTHLVVDVLGYYSADATDANGPGLLFSALPSPVRLLETRAGQPGGCYLPAAPLLAQSTRTQEAGGVCMISSTAKGIIGHATTVSPQSSTYFTFYPSSVTSPPLIATSNFVAGQTLNQHFTVGLGTDGAFNIFTYPQTDLVIDVSGYFAP